MFQVNKAKKMEVYLARNPNNNQEVKSLQSQVKQLLIQNDMLMKQKGRL